MFFYTVRCEFAQGAETVAAEWLSWLKSEHIEDVLRAGADSSRIVKVDQDEIVYEVRYRFASRERFAAYEREHAGRLRAEGLQRFPLELGLTYSRVTAEQIGEEFHA